MTDATPSQLLIEKVLPDLADALVRSRRVILSAPPGAGKTTRVPLALLSHSACAGQRILLLEPRRLAARRAAEYMASLLREPVGRTVGYRIRGESVVSRETRIEVITEGILTRAMHDDAALNGTAVILFDEFHERSIHADLGLAFALDVQDHLREDLRIVVMSATLDGVALASLMPDTEIIRSEGRAFPVETRYASFTSDRPMEQRAAEMVQRALENEEGDVLVFLPGRREINRTEERLRALRLGDDTVIHILHGESPAAVQSAALAPDASGRRKVILATNVAETSLTIDGVRIVVDSGMMRAARFEPTRGMTGLVTVRVSQASADQRRGRAGRQGPGVCYRLWTEAEHASLPEFNQPEIKAADLSHLALDLARWGDPLGTSLRFIDPPPAPHLAQARSLLRSLGALDASGGLTSHGRALSDLPIHPRLAHMLVRGSELGTGEMACQIAALLEERDLFAGQRDAGIDLHGRLEALTGRDRDQRGLRDRIRAQAERLERMITMQKRRTPTDRTPGVLLALAYPERVAQRKEREGNRYLFVNGTTGILPAGSLLARSPYLAVGDVDGAAAEVKIFLAASLEEGDLRVAFSDAIEVTEEVRWDVRHACVVARRMERLGAIILKEVHIEQEGERILAAVCDGIRSLGIGALPWSPEAGAFRARSEWLRTSGNGPDGWPELSDDALVSALGSWGTAEFMKVRNRNGLERLPLAAMLGNILSFHQRADLDRLAPSHISLPSGTRAAIDYTGPQPVLAVKLQELFGQTETPRIAGGRVPLLCHLLTPASRPLAVTQDLRSFWINSYPGLRTQMKAKYSRHVWPEDPLASAPVKGGRKRR